MPGETQASKRDSAPFASEILTNPALLSEKANHLLSYYNLNERLSETFDKIDDDRNGTISSLEFLDFIDERIPELSSKAGQLFSLLDTNGDELLDFDECKVLYYLLAQLVCGVCERIITDQGFMACTDCLEIGEVHGECASCFKETRKRSDLHFKHKFEYMLDVVQLSQRRKEVSDTDLENPSLSTDRSEALVTGASTKTLQTQASEDEPPAPTAADKGGAAGGLPRPEPSHALDKAETNEMEKAVMSEGLAPVSECDAAAGDDKVMEWLLKKNEADATLGSGVTSHPINLTSIASMACDREGSAPELDQQHSEETVQQHAEGDWVILESGGLRRRKAGLESCMPQPLSDATDGEPKMGRQRQSFPRVTLSNMQKAQEERCLMM